MAPLSRLLPRIPDGGHTLQTPKIHQRRGAGRGPRHRPIFPPDLPIPQSRHKVDQEVQPNTRVPRARQLPPQNAGILCRAQPAAPCGIPHRQSTKFSGMLLRRAGDQGTNVPTEPTRMTSEEAIHQGARSQGAPSGTTGATSAHVTCETVARGTFFAAPKAMSVKEREGGPDTDLSFLLTSLSRKPDKRRARGCSPTDGTHEPPGSLRRTRECYAEPSPPCHTGFPDTRAHQP